jgi:hypothetical protein
LLNGHCHRQCRLLQEEGNAGYTEGKSDRHSHQHKEEKKNQDQRHVTTSPPSIGPGHDSSGAEKQPDGAGCSKTVQMQGAQEPKSEAYSEIR